MKFIFLPNGSSLEKFVVSATCNTLISERIFHTCIRVPIGVRPPLDVCQRAMIKYAPVTKPFILLYWDGSDQC